MIFNKEVENERKKYLGLDKVDTEKVYTTIIEDYKKRIIEAPRKIFGYTIDIVICNINYYNRLGDLKNLNSNWGDSNFFVDLKHSVYMEMGVNDDGNIESYDDIEFNSIEEFKELENISFSLKEIIELCKKDNFEINIFTYAKEYDETDREENETTIEITPYMPFKENDNIKTYLDTLK